MNPGKVKFFIDRWSAYVGKANFFMILILFIRDTQLSWWWVVAGFVLSVLFMFVDAKWIAPKEYEYISLVNPAWNDLASKVDKEKK